MEKRVLITGISGFAGSYLASRLQSAGYIVHGTVMSKKGEGDNSSVLHVVDLRDYDHVKKLVEMVSPTHVVHLAAISFVGHHNVNEIYETNIVGTRNLLAALSELSTRPKKILITSSANVYGNSENKVLSENDVPNPVNDYAVSKVAMEYMARQFYDKLNIVIARPFNYTGRGQSDKFLIPKIVNHFRSKSTVIELGNVDIERDFSDVRTVVEYMVRLLELSGDSEQVFNICSGDAVSLKHVINLCQMISGRYIEVSINEKFVRVNEVKTLVGDASKLHSFVGKIKNITIEDTLRWMLTAPQ